MPSFSKRLGFNLGENLACVLIAYPNTKSQSCFATVSDFFHLSFCSVLYLSLAQLYAHELDLSLAQLYAHELE